MKIEIDKPYINWLTDAKVTVTKIDTVVREVKTNGFKQEKEFRMIHYNKDVATPGGMTATGEMIDGGTIENVKPEYVFLRCYKPIN